MKLLRTYIICLVLWLPAAAGAQTIPTLQLGQVLVEGNDRASEDVIRSTTRLFPGRSVTAIEIQRGIQRLWELGFFADIQIYQEAETDSGVVIRIAVREYPSLEEVEFEGNKKINKNKLKEEIGIRSPQILTDYAISESVRKLRALYHEDGYLNVEITTRQEPGVRPHGRNLIVTITENKKVKLRKIRFVGNEAYSQSRLRRQLKETKTRHWYTFWRSPFDQDKFQEDLFALESYYRNHGYRDGRVVHDTVMVTRKGKGLELLIEVYEGVPYYYREFKWEGNILHTDEELERALGFERGDRYNKERFDIAVSQKVHPVYMDEGYLYSRVEPREIPVGEDSIDVVFVIVENQKVAIRYINITGNDKTRDYVVRRELRINPGETFSYEKLGRSQRDVWILNFFDNVEPNVLPVDEDEVDLSINITERSTERANLSVGYTEQYGMIGGGGVEFNNLAGTGQRLNISYNRGTNTAFSSSLASQQRGGYQSISVSLVNPWLLNTPNLVGASAFYSERGQGSSQSLYLPFDIVQRGGSLRWGRRFRWPDSFFRGQWIFQGTEKRYIGGESALRSYLTGIREQDIKLDKHNRSYVSTLGVSFVQAITRDSR
ncbi:MAG: outer membrane protein assembly factor BamA, partial [Candidatus Neomarinimicrobiota bacterium]